MNYLATFGVSCYSIIATGFVAWSPTGGHLIHVNEISLKTLLGMHSNPYLQHGNRNVSTVMSLSQVQSLTV